MSGLDAICLDVLGDYVPMEDVSVYEDRKSVFVWLPAEIPSMDVRRDWTAAIEGTEYQDVRLVIGVRP